MSRPATQQPPMLKRGDIIDAKRLNEYTKGNVSQISVAGGGVHYNGRSVGISLPEERGVPRLGVSGLPKWLPYSGV